MKDPKYPHDLSMISEIDSASLPEEKDRESHIMSVSKSFCGATAALMAADGNFGPKKMQASLMEVLNEARKSAANRYYEIEEDPNETIENLAKAKKEYSKRIEGIGKYEEAITAKGCGDITMSELLSHRSGLVQEKNYFEAGNLSNLGVFDSKAVSFDRTRKDSTFSYCNPGFVLAEDMMSLVSNSNEGYYGELKNRVIEPLGLNHTKSVYESEEAKSSVYDSILIEGVMYDYGVKSKKTSRSNFLNGTQKGSVGLSEGGLCSSVNDLETFYEELSKTACGIPSKLTPDPEKAKEVHEFYLDAYEAGKNCKSDSSRGLSEHCAKHYSLGTIIQIENGFDMDQDVSTPSRGNEDKKIAFWHIGNRPGSNSSVSATMPFSFAEFESGTAELKEGEKPQLKASITQQNILVQDSLLTIASCDYIAKIDEYFCSKCDKLSDKTYNDNWRTYNQYWEAARNDGYVAKDWQKDLITKHRLPKDFDKFHDEIRDAYQPAKEVLRNYITENYLDDNGVINQDKIDQDFRTAEDFERVRKEVLGPHLEEAHKKTEEILARCDEKLKTEQQLRAGIENSPDLKVLNLLPDSAPDRQSWVSRVTDKDRARDDTQINSQDVSGAEELWANRVSKSANNGSEATR